MSDVVLFKVTTGEELIATMEQEEDNYILFSKVRALALVPAGDGQQFGVQLFPFLIGAQDGTVPIDKKHIVTEPVTPTDDLTNRYLEATTGFEIATGNLQHP